jgi:GH24 family phage-related lysozyme (muramidase)
MQKLYGNYLGICINNTDPEFRGRVQIFIPHILPALYDRWNKEGKDIKIEIVGNNLEDALPQEDIEQLKLMLPWAEAATPVFGNSAAGHYNPETGNFNQTHVTEQEATTGASAALANGDVSGSLIDFIKGFEGFSPTPYEDYGQTSIGYGTRAQPGDTSITKEEATRRLEEEVAEAAGYVNTAISNRGITGLTQRQIDALTSFTYNNGPGRPSGPVSGSGGLRELLDSDNGRRDWTTISAAMPRYVKGYVGGPVLRGLVKRRALEVAFGNHSSESGIDITGSNAGIDLNNPASGGFPGSANPAQHLPQLESENPTYLQLEPNQQAVLDAVAGITGGSGGPLPGGSKNGFDFGKAKGNKTLVTYNANGSVKMTYCGRGTLAVASYITGGNFSGGFNGNDFSGANKILTGNATSGPWKGKPLYSNEGIIQGSTYQPQQGDVMLHKFGTSANGRKYGHAQIFVNGSWHSFATEGNTLPRYLGIDGQQSNLFRLTPEGQQAMLALGRADTTQLGVPYEGTAPITTDPTSALADENNGPEFDGRMARNPTSSQPTVTDTTGMPQGMFSIPNPGAMLWVFFREGDPLYPVYFAASYGATEWQNAFKAGSSGAHYPTAGDTTPRNQAIFRPNQAGGISFVDTLTEEKNARSIRMFHENGGHLEWHHHGSVLYSPNEHIQQVAGNAYNTCLNREDWTQGTNNSVTIGDKITIVGNASQESLDYIEQHAQIVKDINKNMLKNGGGAGGGSSSGTSSSGTGSNAAQDTSNPIRNFFRGFENLLSGKIQPGQAPAAAKPAPPQNQSRPS